MRINEVCSEAKMANVLSHNWRWVVERLDPENYGPKIEIKSDHPELLDALRAAIKRVESANLLQQPTIPLQSIPDSRRMPSRFPPIPDQPCHKFRRCFALRFE